jgi:hypothetical protein
MISNFISDRITEGSSHQGAIVVIATVAVLFFAVPLTKSFFGVPLRGVSGLF